MKKSVVCLWLIVVQVAMAQTHPPRFEKSPWDTVILGASVGLSTCLGDVTVPTDYSIVGGNCYTFVSGSSQQRQEDAVKFSVAVNPLLFDQTPQFKLVVHILERPNHKMCFRLFDITVGQGLPSSEVCQFTPLGDPNVPDTSINMHFYRLVSPAFQLANDEHLYSVQFKEIVEHPLPIIIDENGNLVGPQDDFSFGEVEFIRLIAEPQP
jgi:hypothetical protein